VLKRRRKNDEHLNESWLIPYADILTLLLALFIVLFASSQIDNKKYFQIAQAFNSALQGGSGILEDPSYIDGYDDSAPNPPLEEGFVPDEGNTDNEKETISNQIITPEIDQQQLENLKGKMDKYIEDKGLSSKIDTNLTKEGLLLTITEGVLFESGSAEVSGNARKIAKELSNLLVTDPPRDIRIEGHTDNVPINTSKYPSNWELSSARAINFMKVLLENKKLDPSRFSAIGYGEYRPVATNNTPEGKAKNRRVEVLISVFENENEQ